MRRSFLLPVLLLGLAWVQELIDQLLFGGGWNLPMGPWLHPPPVEQCRVPASELACFNQGSEGLRRRLDLRAVGGATQTETYEFATDMELS